MPFWTDVMRVCAGANVLILLGLGYVWGRNYREFRSKHALGLLIFAALLWLENALALYYFLFHPMLGGWFATMESTPGTAMMVLRVLETASLLFLAWVTWD